jgi:glycosyltransferase involved in cell wall biosynthesis
VQPYIASKADSFHIGLYGFTIIAMSVISIATIAFLTIFLPISSWVFYIVSVALFMGIVMLLIDVAYLSVNRKNEVSVTAFSKSIQDRVTVVLTALNDQDAIGLAVTDFATHPLVKRVLVVDNKSDDSTAEIARNNGATVFIEENRGYGQCVFRALAEASKFSDTDLIVLCEGDRTFRAFDIDKLLAYHTHAQIVNGTRIVEQLRAPVTQLTQFMYWGNFIGGKLLELKHLGRGTFTDLGTTYKLCHADTIRHLLPSLNENVNLEFNAHFLDVALTRGIKIVEVPITFHNRVGVSKGGNTSNRRAIKVGIRMFKGIYFGWNI